MRRPARLMAPRRYLCHGDLGDIVMVDVPVRLVTLENQREHWATKNKRARLHRAMTMAQLGRFAMLRPDDGGYVITLTRVAPRKLDPGNHEASFKHVQDAVASWLGIDDGSPLLEWRYAYEKAPAYGVRIRIAANWRMVTYSKVARR